MGRPSPPRRLALVDVAAATDAGLDGQLRRDGQLHHAGGDHCTLKRHAPSRHRPGDGDTRRWQFVNTISSACAMNARAAALARLHLKSLHGSVGNQTLKTPR